MQSAPPPAPSFTPVSASGASSGASGAQQQYAQQMRALGTQPVQSHAMPSHNSGHYSSGQGMPSAVMVRPQMTAQGLSSAYSHQQQPMQAVKPYQPTHTANETAPKRTAKKEDANFGLVFPMHKIKKLIKAEGDVKAISGEGSFAIAHVTELFIEELVRRGYEQMNSRNPNAASLEYDDLSAVVKKWAATDFLLDIVPQTLTLEELTAMVERQEESLKAQGSKAAVSQPASEPLSSAAEVA